MIDDDEDDRDLFRESVNAVDPAIECIVMEDGESAFEYLSSGTTVPDYIFLDLSMPGYNGRKLLYNLRQSDRFKKVPVIIYTTSTNEDESKELHQLGATHFLSKPMDSKEIYYMISHVINEKWS